MNKPRNEVRDPSYSVWNRDEIRIQTQCTAKEVQCQVKIILIIHFGLGSAKLLAPLAEPAFANLTNVPFLCYTMSRHLFAGHARCPRALPALRWIRAIAKAGEVDDTPAQAADQETRSRLAVTRDAGALGKRSDHGDEIPAGVDLVL